MKNKLCLVYWLLCLSHSFGQELNVNQVAQNQVGQVQGDGGQLGQNQAGQIANSNQPAQTRGANQLGQNQAGQVQGGGGQLAQNQGGQIRNSSQNIGSVNQLGQNQVGQVQGGGGQLGQNQGGQIGNTGQNTGSVNQLRQNQVGQVQGGGGQLGQNQGGKISNQGPTTNQNLIGSNQTSQNPIGKNQTGQNSMNMNQNPTWQTPMNLNQMSQNQGWPNQNTNGQYNVLNNYGQYDSKQMGQGQMRLNQIMQGQIWQGQIEQGQIGMNQMMQGQIGQGQMGKGQIETNQIMQGQMGQNQSNSGTRNMKNLNVGNPDEGLITRPCEPYDTHCIREFFAKHGKCNKAHGPIPEPFYRKQAIYYVPKVNLTITAYSQQVKGLNGRIQDFYVNQDTDKVVLVIEYRGLQEATDQLFFRYHRRAKEPVVTKGSGLIVYSSVTMTAIIPKINKLDLQRMVVFAFLDTPAPRNTLSPSIFQSTDPQVQQAQAVYFANMRTVAQELLLTDGPFFSTMFIQNNLCDFGLELL